jgi:glycosyltransferase involved in cell wall biosynthesis
MSRAGPSVRVLVVDPVDIAAPKSGGVLTFLLDFIKFAPADFEITLAGVTDDPVARPIGQRSRVAVGDREVWNLPLGPTKAMPRNPSRLAAMATAQLRLRGETSGASTIVQLHRPYRRYFLAGVRGPRVQFVHVDLRAWSGHSGWWGRRWLYGESAGRAVERADRVYVVNEAGVDLLRRQYPRMAQHIEFLPGWFDEAVFQRPAVDARADLRRILLARVGVEASDGQPSLVLYAGRLDPSKSPGLAIDGFAALTREANEPSLLLVAGDGALRDEMRTRAQTLGVAERVHLLGDLSRTELARVMGACDVFLLTSRAEGGGPRVVLESLACGLPVVAPPVGEVRRTVKHRVNGYLLEERSAAAVARGLRWALEQPALEVSRAAVDGAAPYTARRVLSRLYDAYRRLAAESTRRARRVA